LSQRPWSIPSAGAPHRREENVLAGGFGAAVAELLLDCDRGGRRAALHPRLSAAA
jgi:hypothetical protein